jgi:rod shape-determining protein MreC
MLAANVIGVGAGAGSNAKVVFVNRGSAEGVMRGMAVVTPDGIVGKVISAYPTASEVLLITDPEFAAGVVSHNKGGARGTVKGQGNPICKVDFVPIEDKVDPGEWFYTSGDDRVFPRGFAVGVVKSVSPGQPFQEILLQPSGMQHGLEDVLIILESVHQTIPDTPPTNQPVYLAPPPPQQAPATVITDPNNPAPAPATTNQPTGTEADKLRSIYKSAGEQQNHTFGSGPPGSKPPDFTKLPTGQQSAAPAPPGATPPRPPASAAPPGGAPAGTAAPRPTPSTGGAPAPKAGPPAAPPAVAPAGATPPRTTPSTGGVPAPKAGPPAPSGATQPRPASTGGAPAPKAGPPAVPPAAEPKSNTPAKGAPGGRLPE